MKVSSHLFPGLAKQRHEFVLLPELPLHHCPTNKSCRLTLCPLLHPWLELQNHILGGTRLFLCWERDQLDLWWLLLVQLWVSTDSQGVSQFGDLVLHQELYSSNIISFCSMYSLIFSEKSHCELAEICNFLFTEKNPVVLGKSFLTVGL